MNMPPVTKNIIIINVLFFLGTIVAPKYGINLTEWLGLHFFMASDFKLYQLFTYMFMHGGFEHLFFNMFAVWMFGRILEQVWGPKRFLFYYILCGIGAGIIQEINPDPGYDDYSGEKQAFMSILSTGKYRIKGKISEQNIGELQPGMDVTVRARNNQEEIWKGSVDVIDTEKPESSSQSEMYSGSDSSARATKYPFYVTLETSDGLMLGQHVYIEPGTGVNTEGLHLMTAYIVDADGKEPYVWVANKKDRLEKRNVKLGAYDEEQDTWEITEGLKETDYIVWPDGECKEGAAVQKNENVQAGGMEEGE